MVHELFMTSNVFNGLKPCVVGVDIHVDLLIMYHCHFLTYIYFFNNVNIVFNLLLDTCMYNGQKYKLLISIC